MVSVPPKSPAEEKYGEFDWAACEAWKKYYEDLYPTPPLNKLEKWKRKWYNKNIDSSLEVEIPTAAEDRTSSVPSKSNTSTTSTARSSQRPPSSSSPPVPNLRYANLALVAGSLLAAAGICTIGSLLPMGLGMRMRSVAIVLYGLGFAAATISSTGFPSGNYGAFFSHALMLDTSQAILMTFSASSLSNFIALGSPLVSAVVYLSSILPLLQTYAPTIYNRLRKYSLDTPTVCKLLQGKADIEVSLGFVCILFLLLRRVSFLSCIVYLNLLRLKYSFNGYTITAFRKVDLAIRKGLSYPVVPRAVYSGYDKLSSMISNYTKPH